MKIKENPEASKSFIRGGEIRPVDKLELSGGTGLRIGFIWHGRALIQAGKGLNIRTTDKQSGVELHYQWNCLLLLTKEIQMLMMNAIINLFFIQIV